MDVNDQSVAFDLGDEASPRRLHAIAPVLIGLIAPVLVLLLIDPRALGSASVILHIYLGAIFVIATVAYIISVFDQGDVTRIRFLEADRVIAIERTGLVAKKTINVPFGDIASLRIETRYDDDGYKSNVPLIVLSTREVIELPDTMSEQDIGRMRRLIGRA